MKIKTRISFIVLLLVFAMGALTGCDTSSISGKNLDANSYNIWVDYSTFVYPSGQIYQKYVVDVNYKKILEDGTSAEQLNVLVHNILNSIKELHQTSSFDVRYDEVEAEVKSLDWDEEKKNEFLNGFKCETQTINKYSIVSQRYFASKEHYDMFYDIGGSSNVEIEEGVFFDRYLISRYNRFYYDFIALQNFWGISKVYLTETYASADTAIKSNASLTEITGGIKMHQWEIVNINQKVEFYDFIPVTSSWYILALGLTLLFTLLLAVFSVTKFDDTRITDKSNKKKRKDIFVPLDKDDFI